MKISDQLNLVSQLQDSNGRTAFIHVRPFPYEVVEENCVTLGNLFSQFFTLVGSVGAPRVAAMMLRKQLKADRAAAGYDDGKPDLLDDIQRMATVVYAGEFGYAAVPLATAIAKGIITPEAYRDVEGEIVFFTVSSAIQRADLIPGTVGRALKMYSALLTSSSVSEYKNSLPPLKTEESLAEEETAIAVPEVRRAVAKSSSQESFIPS